MSDLANPRAVKHDDPVSRPGAEDMSLDTWLALVAGPAPWWSDEREEMGWSRLFALGQVVVTLLGIALVIAASEQTGSDATTASIGLVVALGLITVQPIMCLLGLQPRPRAVWPNVIGRFVLMIGAWYAIRTVLPGWHAMWSTPTAAALGIDVVSTCRQLGWRPRAVLWYRNFLASGFNLGITGAVVATLVAASHSTFVIALQNFVSVQAWALTAAATVWLYSHLQNEVLAERATETAQFVAAERRARAHWLHDDICAQLRLVSLKISTDNASQTEALQMLDDLDHHLRLRQLEELFGAGTVRVGEVLQPFIRHAQGRGVTIEGVPAFDRAATALPEPAARLAARAAGVLTSNALNAGATAISFHVETNDDTLLLTVDDDGPGFSLHDIPDGRGLSMLIDDLRPGTLSVAARSERGSSVTATIHITERTSNGQHPSR